MIKARTSITELSRQQTKIAEALPPKVVLTDTILETEVLVKILNSVDPEWIKIKNYCFLDVLANLLLQDTIERIHVGDKYGDIPRGIFLIRGENMVLVGEIVS